MINDVKKQNFNIHKKCKYNHFIMNILSRIYEKSPEVVSKKVTDEYILVPLKENVGDLEGLYTLNEVGAYIWDQIDGKNTIAQIIKKVTGEYNINAETAQKDVIQFIQQLNSFIKVSN